MYVNASHSETEAPPFLSAGQEEQKKHHALPRGVLARADEGKLRVCNASPLGTTMAASAYTET